MTTAMREGIAAMALGLVLGCGGSVVDPGGSGVGGGAVGAGGTGGTGGAGTGGAAAGASGTGGAAGAGGNPAVSCAAMCEKLLQSGCYPGTDCLSGCEQSRADAVKTGCEPILNELMTCIMAAKVTCYGGEFKIEGCDQLNMQLQDCIGANAGGCASIPPSAGQTECEGLVGSDGSCSRTCIDSSQNHWSSQCKNGQCTCSYQGKAVCTCMATCGGPPCCPGIDK